MRIEKLATKLFIVDADVLNNRVRLLTNLYFLIFLFDR